MLVKKYKQFYWLIGLLMLIAIHLFLLRKLIFFPYPELFIYSYLTSKGLLPYKQILDQHFPGLMFFPVNFYTLGMTTPQIARLWHYGVVGLTHVLLFITAKQFFKSEKKALLANFIYLVWQPFFEGYTLWIDSFVPLFTLSAYYFLVKQKARLKSKNLLLSGFFLGIGLIFKQTTLPLIILVGLYLVLRLKKLKKLAVFVIGVSVPIFLMLIYLYSINVWKDFYYWTITFNLTTFAQMGRKLPSLGEIIKSFPLFGLSLFLGLYFCLKGKFKKLALLMIFFVSSLVFAYARFDFIHLQPALPFGILILVFISSKFSGKRKGLGLIQIGYFLVSLYLLIPFYKVNIGNRVLFFGEYEKNLADEVLNYAKVDESIFTLGTTPHIYQLTNTLPPGKVFVFQFPWFMLEAQDKILNGIINDMPKVILRDKKTTVGGLNLVSYMREIDRYVESNYKTIKKIGDTELMLPK